VTASRRLRAESSAKIIHIGEKKIGIYELPS
jgi:hypothetical protein